MATAAQLAREYELVYILRPQVAPEAARKVADRVADVIGKRGAKLTRVDNWGKRKLAYPIEKHQRGIFVYVRYVGATNVVAELERNLRNLDEVIRYQSVRLEELHDLEALTVDPAEIEFRDIEVSETEEDQEPSVEERLGMRQRERLHVPDEDEAEGLGDLDEDADSVPAARDDEETSGDDEEG